MPPPSNPSYAACFRDVPVTITGGAGFIGSHLAHRLLELGARVTIIDDLATGHLRNLPPDHSALRFIQASILDEAALKEAIVATRARYVFHQAAMVSVPLSVEQPDRCLAINTMGTARVLEAARAAGSQRIMFAASAAAYGPAPVLPSRESLPVEPVSPYAASKIAGEALLSAYAHGFGMTAVSLRYFNIFGPRQDPKSAYAAAISAFADALLAGREPTLFGDGLQTRDFCHVDNVVHANLLAASSPRQFRGEVINIGTGRRVSLLEVINTMAAVLKRPVQPVFAPPRAGDVRDSVADISRARDLLAYEPVTSFEDGLAATLRAFAEAKDTASSRG